MNLGLRLLHLTVPKPPEVTRALRGKGGNYLYMRKSKVEGVHTDENRDYIFGGQETNEECNE